MTRSPTVPLVLVLAVVLDGPGCSRHGEKASLPAVGATARAVRTVKPAARVETGLARATGTIRAREDAVLSAKATGQIRRIRVEVGDRVKAGAPLAEMDPTNARIQLENARAMERLATARLSEAERELGRAKQIVEAEGMSQSSYDQAVTGRDIAAAQLDQARAAVKGAQQALDDTVITAPFAGVVTAKYRNAGDTVTLMPVSPIVGLTDVDHLEIKLAVPEALEPAIQPGHVIEGYTTPGGQKFQAKVRVKSAIVEPVNRTVEVIADVVEVDGLRPGTLVVADFGRFGADGGMFVPATAVRTDGTKSWVFVVGNGKAERREVVVAPVHPGTVEVKQGLGPDDEVVVDPGSLASGDAVVALAD